MPWIALDVSHFEMNSDDGFRFASVKIHLADSARTCTHVAGAEVRCYRLGNRKFAGILLVESEIDERLTSVKRHVAFAAHVRWYGPANALIGLLVFQFPRRRVGKEPFKIHFHNLHPFEFSVFVFNRSHVVEIHRLTRDTEHPYETAFGHLNDIARLLMHCHCFAGDSVAAENHPLPIRCPLVVSLINFRVASAAFACQKHQLHTSLRIFDDFTL